MLPKEKLHWMDKVGALFLGWSINMVGPFPRDKDGNCHLLIFMDPFSKWVEIHAMPSLHSWRAAEFLYDNLVAHLGKSHYIRTDNGAKFADSFAWLCKGLGIIHHHITIGNSKAGRMDDQDAQGLYLSWPDQGSCNFLDELFGLGSTHVTYDSK